MKPPLILILLFGPSSFFTGFDHTGQTAFAQQWIKVERDSAGYLIYHPCNGSTPRIYFDSTSITVFWQLDGPTILPIKALKNVNETTFEIQAGDSLESLIFTAEKKIEDIELTLWTFGGIKWMMVPVKYTDQFRNLDNPCPKEMKPEMTFLEIEF